MRPLFARHIPVIALVKHMTDAGSTPLEIQAASARARRVNAHSPVRLASIPGSTPKQIARALAAARIAAKKITITVDTDTDEVEIAKGEDEEDDVEGEEDDVDDDVDDDEDVADPPTPPAGMSSRELRGFWTAYASGARGPSVDQRAAEEAIWSKQGFTAKDFPNLRSKMTKARRAPSGSSPYVKGPDADRRDIIRAARQGVVLSSDHVKMLRKMGLDDAGIAAVAAKMAKTS